MELRQQLIADDIKLQSDTDSEVIVHLVERYLSEDNNLEESVVRLLVFCKEQMQ
ncbi:MAG: hypothetical protein CM1200mP6_10960 [Anaerolineaceae bacterium]|nr:MAG: hypothetical protein CM1200mP6_10960 [Anaerolineaceae bacterium]